MLVRYNFTELGKGLLRCVFLVLVSVLLVSGEAGATKAASSEWTLINEVDGVAFYYQVADCSGNQILLLRVVNASAQKVAGHWLLDISSGDSKLQFPGMLMPLESGGEVAASCSAPELHLSIPVPELDMASLQLSIAATLDPA